MEASRCPACARPYSPGEVTGLGVLRSRPALRGGPYLEFRCPGCDGLIHLIPHGDGRYAPPGQPPPPAASEAERAPPWVRVRPGAGRGSTRAAGRPGRTRDEDEPEPIEIPVPPGEPAPAEDPGTAGAEPGADMTIPAALDLLGIAPTAAREDIERAFRQRSLACHPDKVAHLDPDFQALAERKFMELRRAYEILTS